MDTSRKKTTVEFVLQSLRRNPNCNLEVSPRTTEHSLLHTLAKAVIQSEPRPAVPPSNRQTWTLAAGIYSTDDPVSKLASELYSLLADTVWQLSLNGILRPTVAGNSYQSDPTAQLYCLTAKGRAWVNTYTEHDVEDVITAMQ